MYYWSILDFEVIKVGDIVIVEILMYVSIDYDVVMLLIDFVG